MMVADALHALSQQPPSAAEYAAVYARTVVPGYTVAGPRLNDREKELQAVILARDYNTLFQMLPLGQWRRTWQLGKYSFRDADGRRSYMPFSQGDIRKFVFSPYYTVQPGYTCPDSQREAGVAAHWKKSAAHKALYPASDWKHIWPMYPGGGYPGQTYGCEKYRPSTWVKIRKKVYIAAGVAAAVFLGPVVLSKVGGMLAGGAEAGAGAVAAGTGAGAAGGAGVIATGAKTAGFLATVQKGVGYVNTGRTVNAIIKGEAPPPPIDVSGSSFTEWGMTLAKDQLVREGEKRLTALDEARMRAELEAIQRQIANYVPPGTPIRPSPTLQPEIQQKISAIQNVERQRAGDNTGAIMFALAIPLAALMFAG